MVHESAENPVRPKLGLALSGGGFRAAFFHIGVLAQLADRGVLRHVECLSTVSGGSIVGALYYLHVKRLLESKSDHDITDADYQAIVATIERDFYAGVTCDLRSRTFWNPLVNLKMSFASYSRSDRIGELYDEIFYRPAWPIPRHKPIQMRELKITPMGVFGHFNPLRDNDGRATKVPVLLINATCLNTGRNWRFEAGCMGEAMGKGEARAQLDVNDRYAWPWSYNDIVPAQQDIELGIAVAASACVPGIFPALAISGLYPDGNRIELVDGGVHDNQGVQGLFDMGCTAYVVSDASKQLTRELDPANSAASVLLRVQDILQERVRQEELLHLVDKPMTVMIHLRQGLPVREIPWIASNGKVQDAKLLQPASSMDEFGVSTEVQEALSNIRTDLDAFTEVEAMALMADGYRIARANLEDHSVTQRFGAADAVKQRWGFQRIDPLLYCPNGRLLKLLNIGSRRFFKVFMACPGVAAGLLAMVTLLLMMGGYYYSEQVIALLDYQISLTSLLILVGLTAFGTIPSLQRFMDAFFILRMPRRAVVQALLPALASIFAQIHVRVFSRLYRSAGRLDKVIPQDHPPSAGAISGERGPPLPI
jgi:NTE family protein